MFSDPTSAASTVAEAFDNFDEALKLDPGKRGRAERIHNQITAYLIDAELITQAFLQGSFRRKTMIAPLRDIDKVVILHPSLSGLTPAQVMDRLEQALHSEYPNAMFGRTKHSLKLDLGSDSFDFDVVPAWETDTDDDDVCIANTEPKPGEDLWKRSNTRTLIQVVADRNQATNGRFIHQVRMAKQVVKVHLDGLIPGLHVESWAYLAVTDSMPHDEALAAILATAAKSIGGTYTDPTGVDVISTRLDTATVTKTRPVLVELSRRAAEARRLAAAGDPVEAQRVWRTICGEVFPAPLAQTPGEALRNAFTGGSVTSAGGVSPTPAGVQRSRPTRSWRRS